MDLRTRRGSEAEADGQGEGHCLSLTIRLQEITQFLNRVSGALRVSLDLHTGQEKAKVRTRGSCCHKAVHRTNTRHPKCQEQ